MPEKNKKRSRQSRTNYRVSTGNIFSRSTTGYYKTSFSTRPARSKTAADCFRNIKAEEEKHAKMLKDLLVGTIKSGSG